MNECFQQIKAEEESQQKNDDEMETETHKNRIAHTVKLYVKWLGALIDSYMNEHKFI